MRRAMLGRLWKTAGAMAIGGVAVANLSTLTTSAVVPYARAASATLTNQRSGAILPASSLWQETGAVVMVVRRLG